jgi:hypothetical protein
VGAPARCPVCDAALRAPSWGELAEHLVDRAAASEDRHVMWLNRNVTKHRVDTPELGRLLERVDRGDDLSDEERVRR